MGHEKLVHLSFCTCPCDILSGTRAAGSPGTTLAESHPNSNTQQSKNNRANVVVQQHILKLLKIDILIPETC